MRRHETDAAEGQAPRASLLFGSQKINVRQVSTDKKVWFTAKHPAAGSADLCFLTKMAPEDVVSHLRGVEVHVELGPIEKEQALGTLRSVYCRDPEGSLIEISSYADDMITITTV